MFLPFEPFTDINEESEEADENAPLVVGEENTEQPSLALGKPPQEKVSAVTHMITWRFMIFIPFFLVTFLRKKFMSQNVRTSMRELFGSDTQADYWADFFNAVVPFGFITSVVWGVIVDGLGINMAMVLVGLTGLLPFLTIMVPISSLQYLTILIFVVNASYCFGILFAFIAENFGFGTMATLQGVISTIAGFASLFMDARFGYYINTICRGSMIVANKHLLIASIVILFIPFMMMLWPLKEVKGRHDRLMTGAIVFDRKSITQLQHDSELNERRHTALSSKEEV
eukprot:GHVO01013440.1.p1 GENE.GHVO01013440.1~~GHVO01013440.1.p1  ORF type:complete len:285 (+),score=57.46 GHVO01013440.1:73-927(+)